MPNKSFVLFSFDIKKIRESSAQYNRIEKNKKELIWSKREWFEYRSEIIQITEKGKKKYNIYFP